MRTADRPLPFAGTPEELERYLQEFAERTGLWAARDPRRGGWTLSGGAYLSSNPNTIPLKIRISRGEGGLSLAAEFRALPWTRPKIRRIADYRLGQLVDYLTARVRGSGPEKFGALPFREPFAPYGSGVAAITASFAWVVLTALATGVASLAAVTLASLSLMRYSIWEISQHSHSLAQAGVIPLPSPAEAAATSPYLSSLVFAVPIAFFFGIIHSAALVISELHPRAARIPQASFLFQLIMLFAAWFPYALFLLPSMILVLAAPVFIHLGSTVVWARRRERIREGPRPAKAVLLIAVALAASLAGAAVPRVSEWKDALDRIALFRDACLLDNRVGKAVASIYYRHTLYSAELLKEFYSADGSRPHKQQPVAVSNDRRVIPMLQDLHFTVISGGSSDVVADGRVSAGLESLYLADPPTLENLKSTLDQVSQASFRGSQLRELSALGWHAIYYAGPLAALLLSMGVLAPFVSLLFRRLKPQTAVFALSAMAIVTSLSLVLLTMPGEENPDLAENLADARPAVRHAAAFRASKLDSTAALADPLLKACDDPDLRVRLWAVAALGKSGDKRACDKLLERLDDPEFFVRYRAAEGLGFLRDPRAVLPLVRFLRERSWYEGCYALDALRRIQPGIY